MPGDFPGALPGFRKGNSIAPAVLYILFEVDL